jgi:precorrin-6B methylase 2
MNTADRWREELRAWAIPEEILAAAPESPYGFPTELFRHRGELAARSDPTPTTRRALEALPAGGSVLDVGVGGGATSLPLVGRASRITGVDGSADMLASFESAAARAGLRAVGVVEGAWPDVAAEAAPADVVICGHVFYNVQALPPFVLELTAHARRRVVVELTDRHPWAWMHELWRRFHGLERPNGPTADEAEAVLHELGLNPGREDRDESSGGGGFRRREDAIALVRRRLCLPSERDAEIVEALGDRLAERDGLWSAGPSTQRIATMWWPAAPLETGSSGSLTGGDELRRLPVATGDVVANDERADLTVVHQEDPPGRELGETFHEPDQPR